MRTLTLATVLFSLAEIAPTKLNFTRLALKPCEACHQKFLHHDVNSNRLFEVTISTWGNITEKKGVLGLHDQLRGVLIAPSRILSTANYFHQHQGESLYAYYGHLENFEHTDGFQRQNVTMVSIHRLNTPGQDEYNIAVSEIGAKFQGPFAHVSEECPHFIGKPFGNHCNILSYLPGSTVTPLDVNMHPQMECMNRYRILNLNTNLSKNSFCITQRKAAKISNKVNIDGAPVVCQTTVVGLILLHDHKELGQDDPMPVLFLGTKSFWIQSKALHLKTIPLASRGSRLKLAPSSWIIKLHEFFYQNIYWRYITQQPNYTHVQ